MVESYNIYPKRRNLFLGGSRITNQLILVNILVFIITLVLLTIYGEQFVLNNLALTPFLILSGKNLWTFLTSMFVHATFFHIFANMFSLFFIGNFLEKIIGKKRFFWVYIISGLVGGVFFVLSGFLFNNNSPGVGASGAIFGLLGVLAVLVPFSKIYLIAGPLVVIIAEVVLTPFLQGNLASVFSIIFNILIFVMIFAVFSWDSRIRKIAIPLELPMWLLPIIAIIPLVIIGFLVPLPIGNSAHLGGLVVGLVYGFYLKKKYPQKTKYISRHFS